MGNDLPALLDQTGKVLDEEFSALVEGRLGALADIAERAEALVAHLAIDVTLAGSDRRAIMALRARAEQNQLLLAAAQSGVRTAGRRLAELRGVTQGPETYDRGGQRTPLGASRGIVERRR